MDAATSTSTTASPATTPTASRRGSTTAPSGLPTPTATTAWRSPAVPLSPATGIPRPHVAATTRTPVAVPPSPAADLQTNLPRKTSAMRLATAPAVVPGKKAVAASKPARTPTAQVADAPRAEWNSSVSDLDKLRLSPEEQERRKRLLAPQPGQYLPPRSGTTTAPRTRRRVTPADSPTWPDHPPPPQRAPKVRAAPTPVGDDATSWTADDSDGSADVDEDVRAFERRHQMRKHAATSRSRSRARRVRAAVAPVEARATAGNAWPRDATRRLALALAYARAAVHGSEPLVDESELPEDDDEAEWADAATAARVVDQMAVTVTVLARKVSELSTDAAAERARRVEAEREAAVVRDELADVRPRTSPLSLTTTFS
ncbi:hypothetical protein, variant [Allomyces macrogynus ATCC 38327]|uniref:Uncharacterized protein n=1 Tax=Allomyces macrogynus (strain ATCC 38327) TaxID=578462 RepID=A0A0L0SLM7_ALLM3|nr:hypothetical protein, variant [Allomyces macrogynus ATCC 38327]|eukprot:KNE63280.1 hypothetical protein, variant [Allomyces macrogynus ATCC 38327]